MLDLNFDKMLFTVPKECHSVDSLQQLLCEHPEVQFVSYVGLDMIGNDTDERIPIRLFKEDMAKMLEFGVQTDGSSVALPKIAELNNAKIDLRPDMDVNWYVDYNFGNIDHALGLPAGTLRIPSFLYHNDTKMVGSRAILKRSIEDFEKNLREGLKGHSYAFKGLNYKYEDLDEIRITSATELEFWVKTPDEKADRELLSTSQELKEQYWKRTYGPVRTALEEAISILDRYGLEMEMGHKEVGGVKPTVTNTGTHIMEQLEIDWKYSSPMQACDNESLVKYILRDIFSMHGLKTTYMAKPVEGVAGSGKHIHFGVSAKLKNGELVNLFNPKEFDEDFLTPVGYGALFGVLRNYEAINPFVSSTIDSLNRLKPGYEAPVCIVTSLGRSPSEPSRNRTILIGLIREKMNPLATRFELRSPNPKSNSYLVIAATLNAMMDGISATLKAEKTSKELEKSISKKYGESDFYLETDREYRTELDVFEDYTQAERSRLYGQAPKTVWENLLAFEKYPDKLKAVAGESIDPVSIESYKDSVLSYWATELHSRVIPNCVTVIHETERKHTDNATDYDLLNWKEITKLKLYIAKDSLEEKSLLTRIREALDKGDYKKASKLQFELNEKMTELSNMYSNYKRNIF